VNGGFEEGVGSIPGSNPTLTSIIGVNVGMTAGDGTHPPSNASRSCARPKTQCSSRHTSTETSSTGSGIGGSGLEALTVTLSAPNCDASRSAITAQSRSKVL
jgi:hypothetical protein